MTEKREVLVFVYGSLKKYGSLSAYLVNTECVGEARIPAEDNFIMRDLGAYPALQRVANGAGTAIKGELYIIDHNVLDALDNAEGYPTLYTRELICVNVGANQFKAWVYFINGEKSLFKMGSLAQSPVIQSGEWDAIKGCPVTGTANLSELGKPPETDSEAMDAYEALQTSEDYDDAVDFRVEGPVFISSENGDYWGPFESIERALRGVQMIDPTGVNVLTIGFRCIRRGLSDHELADINTMTENISV